MSSSSPAFVRLRHQALLLSTAVVLVYAAGLNAPFVFDDAGAVLNNPTIRHLMSWDIFFPPSDGSTTTARPLVNVSFALNQAISNRAPWSYHLLNVVMHACSALLFFGIVRRTVSRTATGRRGDSAAAWIGFWAALLWALHPLGSETVECIAQRTELLCGLFYLLTLYAFVRAVEPERSGRGWLALSVAAGATGMMAKEVMVTAPLLVLLYDRTFVAGAFRSAWAARRAYYVALLATWIVLAALLLGSHGARGASAGFGLGVSSWNYLLTQCDALVRYLELGLWPHPLVLDYGTAVATSLAQVGSQAIIVLLLLALTAWALVRRPVLGFVGAGFFVLLAPSSSVVPLVGQTIAEHRMYLPLALLVGAAVVLAQRCLPRQLGWFGGMAAVAFATVTVARVRVFRDELVVWRDNVAHFPRGARGHNNLARALEQRHASLDADVEFARAVALDPGYVMAHYDWGVALLQQDRLPEAIDQLSAAVRLAPGNADAQLNLGSALLRADKPTAAMACFTEALRLRPAADAHFNLGVALMRIGRPLEAAPHFRAALALDTGLLAAREQFDAAVAAINTTAIALAQQGKLDAAETQLHAIIALQPDDANAHANLGNVFALQIRWHDAIAEFQVAVRLRPDDPQLRDTLRQLQQEQ